MYRDAYVNENKMWYFDRELMAMCELNLETHNMRVLANYYGKRIVLPHRIFCVNKVLYVTFLDVPRILKFDMEKEVIREIIEDTSFSSYCINPYIFTTLVGNKIWFVPRYKITPTCYFDLSKELFVRDATLNKEIDRYVKEDEMAIGYPFEYGTQLWIALWNTHRYLRYDLQVEEVELFELEDSNIHLSAIGYDGKSVWLTQTDKTDLICIDDEESIISVDEEDDNLEQQYSYIKNLKNDIVILPNYGKKVVLICKKTRNVRKIEINKEFLLEEKIKSGYGRILGCYEKQEKIYLFPWGIKELLLLNKKEMSIKKININNELIIYKDYMKDLVKYGVDINESRYIGLRQYTECVLTCQEQVNTQRLTNKYNIWNSIQI